MYRVFQNTDLEIDINIFMVNYFNTDLSLKTGSKIKQK